MSFMPASPLKSTIAAYSTTRVPLGEPAPTASSPSTAQVIEPLPTDATSCFGGFCGSAWCFGAVRQRIVQFAALPVASKPAGVAPPPTRSAAATTTTPLNPPTSRHPPRAPRVPPDGDSIPKKIPSGLIEAILSGRCVAFIGSGFSQSAGLPTWKDMLLKIVVAEENAATTVDNTNFYKHLRVKLDCAPGGDVLDQVAQMLEDKLGTEKLERLVAVELDVQTKGVKPSMKKRLELLDGIPFRAIVTTNYDGLLKGRTPLDPRNELWPEYAEVLRGSGSGTDPLLSTRPSSHTGQNNDGDAEGYTSLTAREDGKRPIIKLHGRVEDAIMDPAARFGGNQKLVQALVMTRTGYRKLLHHTPGYGLFVRSLLSSFTVLYLGFSFSDGYLNELRGEVLSMLFGPPSAALNDSGGAADSASRTTNDRTGEGMHLNGVMNIASGADNRVIGYAVAPDKEPEEIAFFKKHEGVEILTWDSKSEEGLAGLENFLQSIKERTSFGYRLGEALSGKRGLVLAHPPASLSEIDSRVPGPSNRGVSRFKSPRQLPTGVSPAPPQQSIAESPIRRQKGVAGGLGSPSTAKEQFDETIGVVFEEAKRAYGKGEGIMFQVVETLPEALCALEDGPTSGGHFDVVVSVFGEDRLGRHSWWELTKKLRSLPAQYRAPLIVANLSYTRHNERRALCLANGVSSFVGDQVELIDSLTNLFGKSKGDASAATAGFYADAALSEPYFLQEDSPIQERGEESEDGQIPIGAASPVAARSDIDPLPESREADTDRELAAESMLPESVSPENALHSAGGSPGGGDDVKAPTAMGLFGVGGGDSMWTTPTIRNTHQWSSRRRK